MADIKISALPAATTPLAGTEVLPIVQSGVTVKVAMSNLIVPIATGVSGLGTGIATALALNASAVNGIPILTSGGGFTGLGDVSAASVSGGQIATQANQETATSIVTIVTPGRQQFHPSAAKAWVKFNNAGTVAASYNITSVTDNGTGDWTINIGTDFSTSNYCGVGFGGTLSTGMICYALAASAQAGAFEIICKNTINTPTDPDSPNEVYAAFFGDQA
jgi:hypothetical protein